MSRAIPMRSVQLALRLRSQPRRSLSDDHTRGPRTKKRVSFGDLSSLDLSADAPQSTKRVVIDAVGETGFTINGLAVRGSVLLMPYFWTIWNVTSPSQLKPSAFVLPRLMLPRPDLVVVGTGKSTLLVDDAVASALSDAGIGLEVMDTMSACQTFNVLNQEGRSVAAAIVPRGLSGEPTP